MAPIALVAQCGGPTAVINASLAAVIDEWRATGGAIWGARNGLRGVASGDWIDLTGISRSTLDRLADQSGSALGGGRDRLDGTSLATALERLDAAQIDTLFLIGGNGTMAAAHQFDQAARGSLQVIGIPKTIDNDLAGTDVSPGFLSAARFAMQTVRGAGLDLRSMASFDDVAVVEVMGRHAGWLTATSALARSSENDAPRLLLLPEAPVDVDKLLAAISDIHAREGICLIAASEGARNHAGAFLGEMAGGAQVDASGQHVFAFAGGVAAYLAQRVRSELGLRCRQMRPDTLYRTGGGAALPLDKMLAQLVGTEAVRAALDGNRGCMIGLQAHGDAWLTSLVPLAEVVGKEHSLPAQFIAPGGMDISDVFRVWAASMLDAAEPAIRL